MRGTWAGGWFRTMPASVSHASAQVPASYGAARPPRSLAYARDDSFAASSLLMPRISTRHSLRRVVHIRSQRLQAAGAGEAEPREGAAGLDTAQQRAGGV